ncbi:MULTISPECIES: aspartate kinase [unclassified Fusibacter]|uniref:aspartate kinase n=1 Tax=unclassified Fusibacter TaxID=2624464 RepID=UPI001012EA99|nr:MULTISPECIES: aspartate kinase [unclassified Fusibacter]MCK8058251.1 aspartate kinase [Fusibacter sp. A2]NPE20834.1 aspartate kinase [Fusibacter sp. A1]RXV63038.1 aspartate kinase [Fusibacter sp. A1]
MHTNLHVLKFGGTSVATTLKMQTIAKKLMLRHRSGQQLVIVVSAMGKSTDHLVSLAGSLTAKPDKRDMDMLLATGEQVSIALLSMALKAQGIDAVCLTGAQAGIKTDAIHSKARIQNIESDRIQAHLDKGSIVVVAGFQGVTDLGDITTLGRGGSDTTAVSLSAALGGTCEIYTDVDGVYSIDPRLYPAAKKLDVVSYDEMLEMASTGAGIMETRAIEVGHKYNVPLIIGLNTMDIPGTLVKELDETMEQKAVTGLTVTDNCLMATVTRMPYDYKRIARLFASLAQENVLVDMISQTAPYDGFVTLSFTTLKDDAEIVSQILRQSLMDNDGATFNFDDNVVKLSVVGVGMVSQTGVASKLFDIFAAHDIPFYQVTTSEISISYTLPKALKQQAVTHIAKAFDL